MPSLPLYCPSPSCIDASHQMTAPGGYEWWGLHVDDSGGDVQIEAMICHGDPLHPRYLRRFARYRRFPTRLKPPLPSQHATVRLSVFQYGRPLARCIADVPADVFHAATDRLDVRAGDNRITQQPDGAIHLQLRAAPWDVGILGPRPSRRRVAEVDLVFRPLGENGAEDRVLVPRDADGIEHRWTTGRPICDVEGEVRLRAPGHTAEPQRVEVAGLGGHSHHYGTAPLGASIRRSVTTRVWRDERAIVLHHLELEDGRTSGGVLDSAGEEQRWNGRPLPIQWIDPTAWGPAYPAELTWSDLRLLRPRVLDRSPMHAHVIYDAEWGGYATRAWCTVLRPRRPSRPIVGHAMERLIDSRPVAAPAGWTAMTDRPT